MRCEVTNDVEGFLAATHDFLVTRPVEHNLVLSLAHLNRDEQLPSRWAWVTDGGRVVGAFVQTPATYMASVTPMPPAAVAALVDRVAQDDHVLPGVNGDAATVARFAGAWASTRGVHARPEYGQRLYRLGELATPGHTVGKLRRAAESDTEQLVTWDGAFSAETGSKRPAGDRHRDRIARRVHDGLFWVWEAGHRPVSMAYTTPNLAGACRIGAVYTPPDHRGHGYAAACVHGVSARLRASGVQDCLLYTQLTNPTPNGIYQRIGYEPIAEILVYRFGD